MAVQINPQLKRAVLGYCKTTYPTDLSSCIKSFFVDFEESRTVLLATNDMSWPITITSNTKVILDANLILSTTNYYFIIAGNNIRITSNALSNSIVDVVNYPGLVLNNTGEYSNVICHDIKLIAKGTTTLNNGNGNGNGWFAQYVNNTAFVNCASTGDIPAYCGGIVGMYNNASITNCNSSGDIGGSINTGAGGSAGGIVGDYNSVLGTITSCYSSGNLVNAGINGNEVDRDGQPGGSGGLITGDYNSGNIINCYSIGNILNSGGNGNSTVEFEKNGGIGGNGGTGGGICGDSNSGNILNCYYSGDTINNRGGIGGTAYNYGNGGNGGTGGQGGGICGNHNIGTVTNCYAIIGTINNAGGNGGARHGTTTIPGVGGNGGKGGGITGNSNGENSSGTISGGVIQNCYVHATINNAPGLNGDGHLSASLGQGGGILGNGNNSNISNCYFKGAFSSNTASGGICGPTSSPNNPVVSYCYSVVQITEGSTSYPIVEPGGTSVLVNSNHTNTWNSTVADLTLFPLTAWNRTVIPYTLA